VISRLLNFEYFWNMCLLVPLSKVAFLFLPVIGNRSRPKIVAELKWIVPTLRELVSRSIVKGSCVKQYVSKLYLC
jgi:hypothetical protein